jgi:hypothetical protein
MLNAFRAKESGFNFTLTPVIFVLRNSEKVAALNLTLK